MSYGTQRILTYYVISFTSINLKEGGAIKVEMIKINEWNLVPDM